MKQGRGSSRAVQLGFLITIALLIGVLVAIILARQAARLQAVEVLREECSVNRGL